MLQEFLKQVMNKFFPCVIEIHEHPLAHKISLAKENYRKDTLNVISWHFKMFKIVLKEA